MFPFDRITVAQGFSGPLTLGAAGLALGSATSSWIEWLVLHRSLARTLGKFGAGRAAILRMLGIAVLAALTGRAIAWVAGDMHPALRAVLVLGPTGLIYLAGTYMLGLAPAQALFRRIRR